MPSITSTNIIDVDALAAIIKTHPKPIIFWDTCGLLDLIRIPARNIPYTQYENFLNPIIADVLGGNFYSVGSEIFIAEWNEHVEDVKSDAKKQIDDRVLFLRNSMLYAENLFSLANPQNLVNNPNTWHVITEFEKIAMEIIAKTQFVNVNDAILRGAANRIIRKIPPAENKEEYKDSAVWETSLQLAQKIQPFSMPFTLYTSNTTDFDSKGIGKLLAESTSLGVSLKIETGLHQLHQSFYP